MATSSQLQQQTQLRSTLSSQPAPATEPASAELTSTESPSTESPSTESPSTESPSTESPSTESPSTGSPSTGSTSTGSTNTGSTSTGPTAPESTRALSSARRESALRLAPLVEGERDELVERLRGEVSRLERSQFESRGVPLSSGSKDLDRLLPERGFARGSLVEWLSPGAGSGAAALALTAAREAMWEGGAVVVMDRREMFYPPAAAAMGLDLEQLVVVRAESESDELWALDQALRCPGVASVWAELECLDWRWFRRLQLAAEDGGAIGHFQRPLSVRGQPTWSASQLLVQPRPSLGPRRFRIEVLRCRGGRGGGVVELEMDDVTGVLRSSVGEV